MSLNATLERLLDPFAYAANEDVVRRPMELTSRVAACGWSPYEVWFTRVRLEQKRLELHATLLSPPARK